MKRKFFSSMMLVAMTVFAVAFTSCSKDDTGDSSIPVLNVVDESGAVNNELILTADKGGDDLAFGIRSNRPWTATCDQTWLHVTPAQGNGDQVIVVNVDPNPDIVRSAKITFKASTIVRQVTVTQEGAVAIESMKIADFREQYLSQVENSSTEDDRGNPYIELPEAVTFVGTVVSDNSAGNIEAYLFALQDSVAPNSGVVINMNDHKTALGDQVMVVCEAGKQVKLYAGLLQVSASSVEVLGASPVDPITVTISEVPSYQSQYIKIENVQTETAATGTWSGSVVMANEEGETITSYVKSGANFASTERKTGSGYIMGLSGIYGSTIQIQPRNAADVSNLDGERFAGQETLPEGANTILYESMGATEVESNTNVNAFSGWLREGLGAKDVAYSTPTATGTSDATVRSTSTSEGAYEGASGGNNVFFGAATSASFTIADIDLGGTTALKLGFGSNTKTDNLSVDYSSDNVTWTPVEYTKNSTSWGYTVAEINLDSPVASLSLRFTAHVASTVRIDDVRLSTDQNVVIVPKPVVTTGEASEIGNTTATLAGSFTNDEPGAQTITEVGFIYNERGTTETQSVVATGTDSPFTAGLDQLKEATTYEFKAYVKAGGLVYTGASAEFTTTTTAPPTVLTVAELVQMCIDAENQGPVGNNMQVKGVVSAVAPTNTENFSEGSVVLTDNNGQAKSGIVFYTGTNENSLAKTANLAAGDQIILSLDNATFGENNGVLQVQDVLSSDLVETVSTGNALVAAELTIPQVTSDYQSVYVSIANVKPNAATVGSTWSGSKVFTDGTNELTVYSRSAWSYAGKKIGDITNTLKAIVSEYKGAVQVVPVTLEDILPFVVPNLDVTSVVSLESAASSTGKITITTDDGTAWTATTTGSGFSINTTSGTGSGEIVVTASAAGGAAAAELGTVVITLNDYPTVSATAIVKQAGTEAPASVDITWNLTSVPEGFPTATGTKTGTYTIEGYEWSFNATSSFYQYQGNALLIGKSVGSYVQLPVIEGKSLVEVKVTASSGTSERVTVAISDTEGNVVSGGENQTMKREQTFTWTLAGVEPGAALRIAIMNSNNAQFTQIALKYE